MKENVCAAIVIGLVFLMGCKSDPTGPDAGDVPLAGAGKVFILNEGLYGDAAGARLTVYDLKKDTVYRDVVEAANSGQHLGSLGDDIRLYGEKAYIAMSGSDNIVALSLTDFTIVQSIVVPGATPHDLLVDPIHGKLFVTMLYKAKVLVLDLATLTVRDSIIVGQNPTAMYVSGDHLFICNSGYGNDKTLTVAKASTNMIEKTITLSDGPAGIDPSPDGTLWVTCSGNAFGSPPTYGKVYAINPQTLSVVDSISFAQNLWGPIQISNDGYAYVLGDAGAFTGGNVHRVNLATKSVTLNFINKGYYSLTLDRTNDELYLGDAKNFSADGTIEVYSSSGSLTKSFQVQKGPGAIVVNR
jgi:hypothetical protein